MMCSPSRTKGLRRIWPVVLGAMLFADGFQSYAAERLDLIRHRGVLVVGVKTDYPPFGMLTPNAQQEGFETDLAENLAQRLGVRLRTIGVNTTNRLQVLDDGRADVTIATLGDTAERREIATLVEPDYYSSGVTLMTRPDSLIKRWSDLRGQTICATQGSYFNRTMVERYLLQLQTYPTGRDAKLAVRDRRCAGWLFDNTAIAGDLLSSEWHGYRTGPPPELVTPWAIAVARNERGSAFERFIGDTVAQWHRDGTLIALERKWDLPPSTFLAHMHALWTIKKANGHFLCERLPDGQWPVACRNPIFVTSTDVTGLRRWGLWLNEKAGVNLTYLYDDYERRAFVYGVALTLLLTVCCIGGSVAVALVMVHLAHRNGRVLPTAIRSIATLARMTPPLLQIYLVFFGLGSFAAARWSLHFSGFWVVTGVLCLYTGAGLMHTFDEAWVTACAKQAGSKDRAPGLRHLIAESSSAMTAALVNVTKATMIASTVAVPELLSASTSIIAEHGNVGTMMNTLMVFFVLETFCVLRLLQWAQRRWCDVRH